MVAKVCCLVALVAQERK